MLNTAMWTNQHGNPSKVLVPDFARDFEDVVDVNPIPAQPLTSGHQALTEKPYVYGRSTPWARRQLIRALRASNPPK